MSICKNFNSEGSFCRGVWQFLSRCSDRVKPPGKLKLLELEPRILYDASPLGVLLDQLSGSQDGGPLEPVGLWTNTDPVSATNELNRLEVIFIDSSVTSSNELLSNLMSRQESGFPGTRYDVYLVDSHADGVGQISSLLAGYTDVAAVHLVSHGADGFVKLGNTRLTSVNSGT